MKKITSIVLALVMILSVMTIGITSVNAEITTPGGNGESVVTLDLTARNLRVTVPSILPIDVDSDNNVTVATNAKISNLSDGPIEVTNVAVDPQNSWTIVPFTTDFTKVPVDTKQYGMTMYDDDVVDGVPVALFDVIEGDSDLAVIYDGNVAIQSNAVDHLDIGHVVFTVAWNSGERLGINDITYGVENTDVAAYMAMPDYDPTNQNYTNVQTGVLQRSDRPASGTITLPDGADTITVTSQADGKSFTDSVSGDQYEVDSLIPGIKYNYQVKDSSNNILKSGKIVPTGQVRMINGRGGTFNIRDLGGWDAENGTLSYDKIYRGGELNYGSYEDTELNEWQKTYFKSFLGISDEIDLRTEEEAKISASAINPEVSYFRSSQGAYTNATRYTRELLANSIHRIAQDLREGKTAYIHCTEGADRTATLCAIIELLCGVSESDVDRDYELTMKARQNGTISRFRYGEETSVAYQALKSDLWGYGETTLQKNVIHFLDFIGVSYDDMNTIRQSLINGSPSVLSGPYWDTNNDLFNKNSATINSRVSSDGSIKSFRTGYLATDYIPISHYNPIQIFSDKDTTLENYYLYNVYDENFNVISSVSVTYNKSADGKYFEIVPAGNLSKEVKYIRFTLAYENIDNVHIYQKEWF